MRWSAGQNVGVTSSFLRLLSASAGDVVAFCDQDDVWRHDHIERGVAALAGRTGPGLWFSNLMVTDAALRGLGRHDLVRRGPSFANALVENVAYGCTMLLNRPAVDLLRAPLPEYVPMHDAWCYLVVSAFGEVVYDPEPTVCYRQHGQNTVGVGGRRLSRWSRRVRKAWSPEYVRDWTRQAEELRRLHGDRLPDHRRRELEAFLAPEAAGRLRYAITGAAHRQDRVGTVGLRLVHGLGRALVQDQLRPGVVQGHPG